MTKRKICVVVASRANYGRIKSVLSAINNHPKLDLQIVVSASALLYRFGKVIDKIKEDGFIPTATAYVVVDGENPVTMAKSTGLAIIELATVFDNLKPDFVLTVADRYETMATAIAASYMNIPLVHTQGGEVTGSIDESVRHSITKLAHIHFPATEKSRERLIKMGEDPNYIFNTGCPAIDAITGIDLSLDHIDGSYGGVGNPIDWNKPYLLVLQHPITTDYLNSSKQINETISAIDTLKLQTVWLWPNVDAGSDDISKALRTYRELKKPTFLHFYRNFSVEDYAKVLANATCAIGNSSSFIREGAYLGTPCVNIGQRQKGRERSKNVLDAENNAKNIISAIKKQINHGKYKSDPLFGSGNAGEKIAEILSYINVNIQKSLSY
jgi:UDP-hydrolysing UDP-N-acetyl-D-glucosamine 2-epimerase